MALIQSGAGASLLTIDPNSLAGRVTLYGPDGQALAYNSNNDRGMADIRYVSAGTTAAPLVIWAIRNQSSGKTLYVSKLFLQPSFVGTGAATVQQYELIKGTGCTALTSATAVTPLIKRTGIANSDAQIGILATGMTLTGVTLGSPFYNLYWNRLTNSATQTGCTGDQHQVIAGDPIELAFQEVLAIRTVTTQAVGDTLSGFCEFFGG
jgi:hypothetical protein